MRWVGPFTPARAVMNFHTNPMPRWIGWVKDTRIYHRVWNWSFDRIMRERRTS